MNNFYYGVVEDRNDPLKVGRVRVRVRGVHTDNKQYIASPDLPWSQVIVPTTSAGLSGFGFNHSLVEGSTVFGMFRDNDQQDFIVMGVAPGVSQSGYKETPKGEIINRTVEAGFNDPRRKTQSEYANTTDGLNPPAGARPNELTLALDTSPQTPKALKLDYEGKGSEIDEYTEADKTLPYYPLSDYYDESDINRFARGTGTYEHRDDVPVKPKEIERQSLYPFNKVLYTESGHMVEMDDTRGYERLAVEHRSGTFYEIHKDGSQVHRVVNDNYTVICKDDEVLIGGKCTIKILGDADIDIHGDADMLVKGNAKLHSDKNLDISASETLSIIAPIVDVNGGVLKLNS
tara:strand:+ start:2149 stop:3186 length:1038 start_codon:yes stop_codon:yes gene_type:complete